MRHTLRVARLIPWSEYNDTEAQIDGQLDGHPVSGRALLFGADWNRVHPGATLEVDAKLMRSGDVEVVDPSAPAALSNVRGLEYVAVGTVLERDGERVTLDSIMRLEVDLELSPHLRHTVADVAVGDRIRVEGRFELDVDPEG